MMSETIQSLRNDNKSSDTNLTTSQHQKVSLRFWEIDHFFKCPVVGMCLTLSEQKQLLKKSGIPAKKKSPFEIHETLVASLESESRNLAKGVIGGKTTGKETIRVEIAEKTLVRLLRAGQVCAADLRCLDCKSKQCLWRLCLRSCAEKLETRMDGIAARKESERACGLYSSKEDGR
jgi:hypothetical protein